MDRPKLIRFLKPYWHWAILAPLFMVVEVAMDLIQPRMIQRIVDQGIAQMDMGIVLQTGLQMIGLALVGVVGGVGCTVFAVRAAQAFGADVRSALFRKIQSLSFGNLDELGTGPLVTRLTNDVTQVQELVSMMLRIMVRAPLMMLGSLVMAILTSPRLALLFLVLGPVILSVLYFVIRTAYPLFGRLQKRLDRLNTVMQENLAGIRVVKAFVRAKREIQRFGRANDALMSQAIRAERVVAVGMPAMMLIVNLGMVGAVWFGGLQVTYGEMHVGQLIAFVNYLLRTLQSLGMVAMLVMRIARAQASGERIREVLASEPEIRVKPRAIHPVALRGKVAFENVTFSYDGDGQEPALKDVSFVAEPGQTVAILGATGSGKSTLVHLIPRFYDVNEGRVTIDDIDVRDMDVHTLRRHIGVALQESVLFTGTIRDNIRYGRPEASDEEVITAARAAQAHDFIVALPQGYDTLVGQRGVNLSGGQRQRIAIARALLLRPKILILDDSTSSVDVETEARIQEALQELMRDCTAFVVAQRISTVLLADKILVLDAGRLVAEGDHRQLLASSAIYREIYDSQLGNGVVTHASIQ